MPTEVVGVRIPNTSLVTRARLVEVIGHNLPRLTISSPRRECILYFILTLLGMALASLLYTAGQIITSNRPRRPDCVLALPPSSPDHMSAGSSPGRRRRETKWIAMEDFHTLVAKRDDVIVIDLRPDSRKKEPASAIRTDALSIAPNQLVEVLTWIPSETIVVLYGATDLGALMASALRNTVGSEPVYVLEDDPLHKEVA